MIGGVLPVEALRLTRAAARGDAAEVRRIDAALVPLWGLFREFGGLRVVYAIAEAIGLGAFTLPLPILPLAAGDVRRVAAALESLADVG